jgi:two-component system, cell cycle sensor histidine kinase and response regulator CckA
MEGKAGTIHWEALCRAIEFAGSAWLRVDSTGSIVDAGWGDGWAHALNRALPDAASVVGSASADFLPGLPGVQVSLAESLEDDSELLVLRASQLGPRAASAESSGAQSAADGQLPSSAADDTNAIFLSQAEELSHIGCFEWDIHSNRVRWSDGLFRIYGLEPQQFEATLEAFLERVVPEDRPQVMQAVQGAMRDRSEFISKERIRRDNGEIRVLESRGRVVVDSRGEPARLVGVCRDITRHVEAEQQRRRAEEVTNLILDHARMVTWEAIPETLDFRFLNGPCDELLGFAEEQWKVAGFWRRQIHAADLATVLERLEAAFAGEERLEFRMQHAAGHFIWAEAVAKVVFEQGAAIALRGVLSDISARKIWEEELRHAHKMEAIGRLAGGVAHDFNNLLTVINTSLDLIELGGAIAERERDLLKSIGDSVERARGLTSQLLMFGRRARNSRQTVDLNGTIKDTENLLRRLLGQEIVLTFSLSPEAPSLRIDPSRLDQLIVNLAANARDSMPTGGRLHITTTLRQVASEDLPGEPLVPGEYVELTVADSGCGMPPEVAARIFEPYFTTKKVGQGSGLGLAVAYGVVREAGGSIAVSSVPGEGSEFRILLPTVARAEAKRESLPASRSVEGSERILLVEDEESVRTAAASALRAFGYEVVEAASGPLARQLAEEIAGDFSLLVTDLVMPEMGGLDLADAIVEAYPTVRVLCLSGYSEAALKGRGGAYPFLAKPFTIRELAGKVREVLDNASEGRKF